MINTAPPPKLPTCTEVVLTLANEFKDWESIGRFKDGLNQSFAYKNKGKEESTYVYFVLTPNLANAKLVVRDSAPSALCCKYQSYWQFDEDLTCLEQGTPVYVVFKNLVKKESI